MRAGDLLVDCYKWILDHEAYQALLKKEYHLLWIKGDPGKGKTMLLCGIINEMYAIPAVGYFFCQATYDQNSTATAVLRGLLWMLADHNRQLIRHIKAEVDRSSGNIFKEANSFIALSDILLEVFGHLEDVILIVDALDECVDGRNDLLAFINKTSAISQC